jgi:coenzyme PQQ biosynthesis enzyme PqqE
MVSNPLALIAEVTHRCPLHCVYCSNPLQLASVNAELSTAEWVSVLQECGKLGMLHAHFTGGEPLARHDLTELIAAARAAGLYTNLITSGIGLTDQRLQALVDAGLDHVQISFQDSREGAANWIAGAKAHAHKIELSRSIRKHKIAFTVNLVVHRQNLDHLEEMIGFIEQLQPERIEIAHTQYYGWALINRAALMPTRAQLEKAALCRTHSHRLGGARLLREVSQSLHGGLGTKIDAHQSNGESPSLSRGGNYPRVGIRKCERENFRVDMAGVVFVSTFPRRVVDGRTLPKL